MRGGVAVARLPLEQKILGPNPSPAAIVFKIKKVLLLYIFNITHKITIDN